MTDTAYQRVVDALQTNGRQVIERGGDRAKAQCPGHDDTNPSLEIAPRKDGKGVVLHCFAGCDHKSVLGAIGLSEADVWDDPKMRAVYRPRAEYKYAGGRVKTRYPGPDGKKTFVQKNAHDRSLYAVERLQADDKIVYLVEGEKACDAVWAMGGVAVATGGAECTCDVEPLRGRDVIPIADRDNAGRKWANKQARLLAGVARSVDVRQAAVNITAGDACEHLAAGFGLDELEPLLSPVKTSATAQPRRSTTMPAVARLQRILDAVAEEVRSRGLVGEEHLAKTLYLVMTSRLLDKLVSAGVKGHSASGKSNTVETVTRFFPPASYLEFTAMSQRALVYSTEEYAHRTLIVYEVTALREGVEDDMTSYFVRSLVSEGRIEYPVTVRDKDGGFITKTIVKEGPTNLIFTTTKTQVHAENETRILSLATDDSREQTARVLLELADESNGDGDLEQWRDLQRWLADAEHRVTIPYARQLALQVAPVAVRLRRDFGSLLALIRAHAVLHQASRARDDTGRIIATLDDYTVVRDLVADTIAEGVGATVSDTVRETVTAVGALASKEGVMARDVAEKLGLDKSNVSRRLRMAAEGGYLRNLEDKRGKPGRWVIGDSLPESVDLLPDPAQLATAGATANSTVDLRGCEDGCAVAPEFQGEKEEPSVVGEGLFAAHNG